MPGDADATSYAQRFQQAVAAWREALADAELPVLTVQLNRVCRPGCRPALQCARQRQVARQVVAWWHSTCRLPI